MTAQEAKIIGDIDRELKNAVTLPIKKGASMGRTPIQPRPTTDNRLGGR